MLTVYEATVYIIFKRFFFFIKNIVVAFFHFIRLFLWQIIFSLITLICNKCGQLAKFCFDTYTKTSKHLYFF